MNEEVQLEDLAYKCSDSGELTTKIIDQINLGNKVCWIENDVNEQVSLNSAFDLLGEEEALKHLSNIKHDTYPVKFSSALDQQVSILAIVAARSYKGQYDV